MAGIVIFNKDQVIFPGMLHGISGEIIMTKDFMDTPYGLLMPTTKLSFGLLRFLKNFTEEGRPSIGYKPHWKRFLTGILLSNTNHLEEVFFHPSLDEDDRGSFIDIIPMNDKPVVWQVMTGEADRTIPLSDMAVTKKDYKDVVKFIDENTTERYINPIVIDRQAWVEERKNQGKELVLNGRFYPART